MSKLVEAGKAKEEEQRRGKGRQGKQEKYGSIK